MTNFIFKGKYKSEEDLPVREHAEGAVAFREPENMKKLAIIANIIALVVVIPAIAIFIFRFISYAGKENAFVLSKGWIISCFLFMVSMPIHEFIHGLFFNGEVFMYENLKQGLLFVTGVEDFTKSQFIIMSVAPTVIFGVIPYIIGIIKPDLLSGLFGIFGAFSLSAGGGDFINIFNAINQMPKGSKCYMYGLRTFWYMPKE